MRDPIGTLVSWFMTGTKFFLIWLFIALFIPGLGTEHIYTLIMYVIIYPAAGVFQFFSEGGDNARAAYNAVGDAGNPVQMFGYLVKLGACTGLALMLPALYFIMWICSTIFSVIELMPFRVLQIVMDGKISPEAVNDWHLLSGRTTIQDTYDAEVQANAIAAALKNHR